MLEIKNLAKSFVVSNEEKVVLKDFNLQVDDGQFLVVIGSNGSGKSTLLNLIAGVHNCDEGKIILHKQPYYIWLCAGAPFFIYAIFLRLMIFYGNIVFMYHLLSKDKYIYI